VFGVLADAKTGKTYGVQQQMGDWVEAALRDVEAAQRERDAKIAAWHQEEALDAEINSDDPVEHNIAKGQRLGAERIANAIRQG